MSSPAWLLHDVVIAMHDMQLAEHRGASGLCDRGVLASALARPLNLHPYGEEDLCRLAAAYAAGIIANHSFVDASKRTGLLALFVFLKINGADLKAGEVGTTIAFLSLA